jgi:hypothetical protein
MEYIKYRIGFIINSILFLLLVLSPVPYNISRETIHIDTATPVAQADDLNIKPVNPPKTTNAILTEDEDILDIFRFVLRQAANIFWILAIIFIFYSAYLYLTSAGDKTAVTTARNYLMYAIIAMAIGIISYSIPGLVQDILKTATGN